MECERIQELNKKNHEGDQKLKPLAELSTEELKKFLLDKGLYWAADIFCTKDRWSRSGVEILATATFQELVKIMSCSLMETSGHHLSMEIARNQVAELQREQ